MSTWINPVTNDYVRTAGMLASDPYAGIGNAVYMRLRIPLGFYWADKTLGSRLHELRREKDVPRVYGLAKQYAEDALKPLVTQGRVNAVTVQVQQINVGMLGMVVEVETVTGQMVKFKHFVRVG